MCKGKAVPVGCWIWLIWVTLLAALHFVRTGGVATCNSHTSSRRGRKRVDVKRSPLMHIFRWQCLQAVCHSSCRILSVNKLVGGTVSLLLLLHVQIWAELPGVRLVCHLYPNFRLGRMEDGNNARHTASCCCNDPVPRSAAATC